MNRWLMLLAAPAILLPALAVIGVSVLAGGRGQAEPTPLASTEFPEFVYYSAKSEQGYRLAVENRQLFTLMPCYCGCANIPDDPHRNLLDCFIKDDGSFDPHASGCEVCDDIAIDVAQWRTEGKAPSEIHSLVDAKYQSYGPSTDS
jgi:hypothetical protein